MLAASVDSLKHRAEHIQNEIGGAEHLQIDLHEDTAPVGGGSLPGAELPTFVLSLKHSDFSADDLARRLRLGSIRLFCRIHQDEVIIDLRSVLERLGNRGYRAAQIEGGIVGGRLYLAAYAQRFGATGLTFFDDEVVDFFSPHAAGKSVMFLVALGHPDRVALGLA